MKKYTSIYTGMLWIALAWSFGTGCSKTSAVTPTYSVASLNVVNALPSSAPLILIQGPISSAIGMFSGIGTLSYAGTSVLTPMSGVETLVVLQGNADTALVTGQGGDYMFNSELNFAAGNLYSLFITGADTTSPDYLFVQDTVRKRTDSTAGIRFVNLSAGSNPVSVDIQGQANGSVIPSLAYKGITGFLSFPAISTISSYIFEFRDAVSGNLLASYTLSGVNTNSTTVSNTVLFRNLTIALIGQPAGGNVAQTCIRVNSF
jgi:Domain of unknown function (DUF4397)